VFLQRRDQFEDVLAVVGGDIQLQPRGQLRNDVGLEPTFDLAADLHRVTPRDLDEAKTNGRTAVEAPDAAVIRQAVFHRRDIAQIQRAAIPVTDDHAFQLDRIVVLEIELQQLLALRIDQVAAGQLNMLIAKRRSHVLDRDAKRGHALEIEVDPDGPGSLAADDDCADTIDGLEPFLHHRPRVLHQLLQRPVAGQRDPENREGAGLSFRDNRRLGLLG
jgi:hypothetical protein